MPSSPVESRFCIECGTELPEGAKFCPSCGTQVAAPPEPAEEAVPEAPPVPEELRERYETARKELRGDRREVVVLFADVVGFTSMAESMDAEDVSMTMQGWLGELSEVVYRYEGYVDKYIGDAIMALFGAPVAHEDDPERAVHAALEMEGAAEKWGGGGPDSPTLRIGLNLGDVVAAHLGDDQRMQYTAMGDAVNVASRLESAAEPGTVLISDALKRRVEGVFETSEVEPLEVKGKARSLRAYRVVARKERREAKRGPGETSFVDRETELAAIEELLSSLGVSRAPEAETAPALLVEGDTGTGKSRLVREAFFRAEREVRTIEIFFSPFALPGALSPATELFRWVAGGEGGGAALVEGALDLLGEAAGDHRPGVLGLALQADPEAEVESPPEIDPETARQNRWLALAALLARASERQPVALVFEDLHWAEEGARELIAFLLSSLAGAGAGLLLTTRAVGEEAWLPEAVDRLSLEPLAEEDAKTLLGDVYRELPLEVRRDLLSRSQGNPLYLVELSSALSESVEDPAEATLPGSVRAILRSRIDRLSGPVEYLLQLAAVLGIRFPTPLLERMYALESRTMKFEDALEVLEDTGFLQPVAGGEGRWRFRHTLARDVAYGGLLRRVRKVLHESAARLGEEHFEGRIAEQAPFFAHHYWETGLVEEAVPHLWIAGRDAAESYDLPAAQRYLRRVEEALKEHPEALVAPEERAELYETGGTVLLQRGELDDAEAWFRRLQEIGADRGRSTWEASGLEHRGRVAWYRGRLDEARRLFAEGLERLREKGGLAEAALHNGLGLVAAYRGRLDTALEHHRRALELRRKVTDRLGMAKSHSNLGNLHVDLEEDLGAAEREYERALELAREISDRSMECSALSNLGRISMERGEWERALERFGEVERMVERIGWSHIRFLCLQNQAYCEIGLGRIESALRRLDVVRRKGDEVLEPVNRVNTRLHLFDAYLRARADERAGRVVEEARALVEELGVDEQEDEVRLCEGRMRAARGEWTAAVEAFGEAAGAAEHRHHPATEKLARAHRCRAAVRAGLPEPEACPREAGGRRPVAIELAYLAADAEASRNPSKAAAEALEEAGASGAELGDPGLERAAFEQAGEIWKELGDDEAARRAFERALEAMRTIEEDLPEELRGSFAEHPSNVRLRERIPAEDSLESR